MPFVKGKSMQFRSESRKIILILPSTVERLFSCVLAEGTVNKEISMRPYSKYCHESKVITPENWDIKQKGI